MKKKLLLKNEVDENSNNIRNTDAFFQMFGAWCLYFEWWSHIGIYVIVTTLQSCARVAVLSAGPIS